MARLMFKTCLKHSLRKKQFELKLFNANDWTNFDGFIILSIFVIGNLEV